MGAWVRSRVHQGDHADPWMYCFAVPRGVCRGKGFTAMTRVNLTVSVPRVAHVSADGKHCGCRCPHNVTDQVFHMIACWLNKGSGEQAVLLEFDEQEAAYRRCKLCLDSEVPQ